MIAKRTQCRMCGSRDLTMFLDLGDQPPANRYLKKGEWLRQPEPMYPLRVYFCNGCNLVQLLDVVPKEELFSHYLFLSSGVGNTPKHFQEYARMLQERFLKPGDFVVEIGGNDGVLLAELKNVKTLNVEPAQNIAPVARARGIETIADFWTADLARRIKKEYGSARLILGNNSIPHIDNQADVTAGVKELLADDGIYVVQAHYLGYIFDTLGYGDIYHEHMSYFAVRPLIDFYKNFGFHVFDYQFVPWQGVSIRAFMGPESRYPQGQNVTALAEDEIQRGYARLETYTDLARKIERSKDKLASTLADLKNSGARIAAYGAAAKGMPILNYAGLTNHTIDFCVDDMPEKQGLYTPLSHIPIISRESAKKYPVDYFLIVAWDLKYFSLEKEKEFVAGGGKFIMPIGDIEILS